MDLQTIPNCDLIMQADTTPEAEAARLRALMKLTGAERFRLAIELSEVVREIDLAGRRERATRRRSREPEDG